MPMGLGLGLNLATLGQGVALANMVLPVISGTTTAGQTLSVTNGTWAPEPDSYAYQWWRADPIMDGGEPVTFEGEIVFVDPEEISGATSSDYALTWQDADLIVWCVVTATRAGVSVSVQTDAVGPVANLELVTNGTFGTDITGWSAVQASPTLTWVSGTLRITTTTNVTSRFSQGIATVIGAQYRVQGDVANVGNNCNIIASNNANLSSGIAQGTNVTPAAGSGSFDFTFTATATTTYVGGTLASPASAGLSADYDNISVTRIG